MEGISDVSDTVSGVNMSLIMEAETVSETSEIYSILTQGWSPVKTSLDSAAVKASSFYFLNSL
jgi:hypothetical protein